MEGQRVRGSVEQNLFPWATGIEEKGGIRMPGGISMHERVNGGEASNGIKSAGTPVFKGIHATVVAHSTCFYPRTIHRLARYLHRPLDNRISTITAVASS